MRCPVTSVFPPSSTTCRTTMSQHSSGSQRKAVTEDERLLTQLPRERRAFTRTDSWRVLRIMGEFVEGFDTLSDVYNAVTIFGSARTPVDDPYYEKAVETARMLAEEGFPIITGGGPGIMEAANRGCQEGNGLSIGCNIELPFEQGLNPYVERAINFRYFFVRKTMFVKYSTAFIVFPPGYGTMDELFEALTLIQTGTVRYRSEERRGSWRRRTAAARKETASRSVATSSCRSSRGSTPTSSAPSTSATSSSARRCL